MQPDMELSDSPKTRAFPFRIRSQLVLYLLAPAVFGAQASLPDPATATATSCEQRSQDCAYIEGHVANLLSGEPVRRASVTLQPSGVDGKTTATMSDARGGFHFEGLEPGIYTLSAERTGFLRQEYGARRPFSAGAPIVVAARQDIKDIDLKLTPQSVISGKVLDEEGDPVENVTIQVLLPVGRGSSRRLQKIDDTETNDRGEFRIPGLGPGTYILAADRPDADFGRDQSGQAEEEYVPTFYPGVTELLSAVPVQLVAGQETSGRDFQLRKAKVYRLSGRVVRAGSSQNIQLTLLPRDPAKPMTSFAPLHTTMRPDSSFAMRGVQPGSYDLTAMRMEGRQQLLGRLPVEVTGNVDGLTFPVGESVEFTGLVQIDDDRRAVLTRTLVLLFPWGGPPQVPLSAMIEEDGSFRIGGVPRDLYRLDFLWLPEDAYVKSIRMGGQEVLEKALDLNRAAASPVEIALSVKAAVVEGLVQADGKPAAQSEVILAPEPSRPNQPYLYKRAFTDQKGRFRITGVAPGEYKVNASGATMVPVPDLELADLLEGEGVKVNVREGGHEHVELKILRTEGE